MGGTGGGMAGCFAGLACLFFLRRRRKKKQHARLARRRAATADPTPMPMTAGVLRPLEEDGELVSTGTRSCVGMGIEERPDVRVTTEKPCLRCVN